MKNLQEMEKNCWQNCIQIIIEDSIGSHAKKVSRKD